MDIFFNDYKFEEQCLEFDTVQQLKIYLQGFVLMCSSIKEYRKKYTGLALKFYASNQTIKKVLDEIDSKELTNFFLSKLSRVNVKYWDTEGNKTKNDNYFYYLIDNVNFQPPKNEDVSELTIAEAVERKHLYNNQILLINLPGLFFKGHKTHKVFRECIYDKEDIKYYPLECTDSAIVMGSWIEQNVDPEKYKYDLNSDDPPRDEQTCLRNSMLFERIASSSKQGGRYMYKNKSDNTYWYVDSFHIGKAAHLEVFDAQGTHLGEASLEGDIDTSKCDKGKRINLN